MLQGGGGSGGAAGGLKFTVADTCERIKEEFNFIQQQNHSWVFLFSLTLLVLALSLSLSHALCFSFSTTSAQLPLSSFLVYSSLPSRVRVSRRSTIIDADACLGCLLPIFPRLSSFVPLLPVSRLFQNPPRWRCCTPIASKSLIRERKVGIVCSRRPLLSRLLITRRTFRTLAGFSRKPDTRITGRSPVENLTQRFAANLQWLTNVYFDAYQRTFSRICYAYRIKHFGTLFNTVTKFKRLYW